MISGPARTKCNNPDNDPNQCSKRDPDAVASIIAVVFESNWSVSNFRICGTLTATKTTATDADTDGRLVVDELAGIVVAVADPDHDGWALLMGFWVLAARSSRRMSGCPRC